MIIKDLVYTHQICSPACLFVETLLMVEICIEIKENSMWTFKTFNKQVITLYLSIYLAKVHHYFYMFTTNSTMSVINITKVELDITMIRKLLEICVLYKQFNIHSQQSLLNYFIVIPMCLYLLNNLFENLLDMEPSKKV